MLSVDPRRLWELVGRREASADGLFVYAVRTTGVFCRPGCPSRRPNREHVEFFPTPDDAARAGYRACRRCRPDMAASSESMSGPVRLACRAIEGAPARRWSSAALAAAAGTSIVSLRRAFRRWLGISPREYVAACRRQRLMGALKRGHSISDSIYGSGYGSASRVYGRRDNSVTLASYRKGGQGATMEWTTVASPIGRILVAATARGVSFVAVGGSETELVRALEHEYPRAVIKHGSSPRLKRMASAARAVTFGKPISSDIPADIAGTAFQWRVWRALTRIPPGATRTYTALAKAIGAPTAVRAAARACATNPAALIIPCHRVVGSDGSLRGYRWGLDVKRELLARERR